jgi:catechol 2,3-dioxygenase-like lactoylglutathione lyase family enzyme
MFYIQATTIHFVPSNTQEAYTMKSSIGHIQINVNPQNLAFYKDLLGFLGWSVWYDDPAMLGVGNEQGSSLWFDGHVKPCDNDYDGVGMNHLGLAVKSPEEVDQVVAFLQSHDVKALFETPRHRAEFCSGPENDYYQVMFESPDRVLFEVVYTGPASQ